MIVEKDQKIWDSIKERARLVIGYGQIPALLKVQDGKIILAEIKASEELIRIG